MSATVALPDGGVPADRDTPDQPVPGDGRLVSLDFIRGVAVLGILFANVTAFGHPVIAYYWPGALPDGGNAADGWFWLFQFVLVDGKFRALFTLLFGAGICLFVERAVARGLGTGLQARRLALLLAFGAAHFFLLFTGDILFLYAVSGFVVLLMLHWNAKKQLWIGLAWYVLGSLAFTAVLGSQAAMESLPELSARAGDAWPQMEAAWDRQVADAAEERQVNRYGSYGETVSYRFTEQGAQLANYLWVAAFETIPLMLLGMALYRFGFFAGRLDPAKMRLWGWIGFAAGALVSLAMGWWVLARGFPPYLTQFVFNGPAAFPRLAMALGMASLLVLWAPRAARSRAGRRLVAAGRMAFSNYIGTSVVMMLIFQGWAGGYYGELHRMELLVPVLVGWVLILAWSKPWLDRFRYGPLEWLWRCLTYGTRFPFRR